MQRLVPGALVAFVFVYVPLSPAQPANENQFPKIELSVGALHTVAQKAISESGGQPS